LAVIAVCLWSSAANAEILVAATRTDAIVFGGATYLVDFNGSAAGGTEFQFSTGSANTRVVILFNAECAVEGEETRWVDINIVVDPAGPTGETTVAPSNGDNALCSGNGTSTATPSNFTLDGWVSAVTAATTVLPQAGTHKIKVRVDGGFAGVSRLDDLSLIVLR
jgi:hypothetical protein